MKTFMLNVYGDTEAVLLERKRLSFFFFLPAYGSFFKKPFAQMR